MLSDRSKRKFQFIKQGKGFGEVMGVVWFVGYVKCENFNKVISGIKREKASSIFDV